MAKVLISCFVNRPKVKCYTEYAANTTEIAKITYVDDATVTCGIMIHMQHVNDGVFHWRTRCSPRYTAFKSVTHCNAAGNSACITRVLN